MNSVHLCAGSYSVTAVKFGFSITLYNSGNGTYTISVETTSGDTRIDTLTHEHSGNKSVVQISNLKPCTEYKTNVFFNGNGSGAPCQQIGDTWTSGMGECKSKTPHSSNALQSMFSM